VPITESQADSAPHIRKQHVAVYLLAYAASTRAGEEHLPLQVHHAQGRRTVQVRARPGGVGRPAFRPALRIVLQPKAIKFRCRRRWTIIPHRIRLPNLIVNHDRDNNHCESERHADCNAADIRSRFLLARDSWAPF